MKFKYIYSFILLVTLSYFIVHLSSCKKDLLLSNGALEFSVDTVVFDTVFTTVGSSTRLFKIYNRSSRAVNVSSVYLEGGESSPFRFNLDGVSGVNFSEFQIPGNDSLFAFVEVTLGENNQLNPLIIEDKVHFITNGVDQEVQLAAWGQDAYFHYRDTNSGTWPKDKPHVVYDYAGIDEGMTLTIQAGTKIHLHKNSLIYVYKGALNIEGEVNDKVVIEGDRLEPFYDDVKGQYYGIYFEEALPSTINHAIIKNGTAGVHVFSENPSNTDYTVTITNSEIFNHSSYGIFNYSGGRIKGENLIVHSNNQYAYFLLEGADHDFRHCQFLGYGTDGDQPAVAIKNYFTRSDGITYVGSVNEGGFYNSIIDGSGSNQLVFDTTSLSGVTINYDFNSNLIKNETAQSGQSGFTNNLWNVDPLFENIEEMIFKIGLNSPLRNAGDQGVINTPNLANDIDGNPRTDGQPDIGAYEVN